MKELIDKYYTFTLVFIVLAVALFIFKADKDIVNMIVGALIGAMSVPAGEKVKSMIQG